MMMKSDGVTVSLVWDEEEEREGEATDENR